jgi:putative acetyltransferase
MAPVTELTMESAAPSDYDEITELWEASVRATHHFLSEDDILFFKPLIREQYLDAVDLYCTRDEKGRIIGFLGTSGEKVEMLFIHPMSRGKGVGKALLHYAVNTLDKKAVDVNEQNDQAVGFYQHFGFTIISRSEKDSLGKPYPS